MFILLITIYLPVVQSLTMDRTLSFAVHSLSTTKMLNSLADE
ncbi:hypothetical protein OGZ44_12475 [Lactococcus lactis]|nr:hypothetical protein [Lactococcus lactis]